MKKDDKKQGVYAIRNKVNNKVYIGSTITSFCKRWKCHKRRLRNDTHHSKHLQAAWNKYGESNFIFEILEITTEDKCREREGHYIGIYNSINPKFGYNNSLVDPVGDVHLSEETKAKLSAICKEQWKQGIHSNIHKTGRPSWNKGLKCPNISLTRRNMFSSVEVYKEDILVATFRSIIDLDEWSKNHELPGMQYYRDSQNRPNLGKRTTHILSSNIQRAIRTNAIYRGFKFKRALPLSPEMGVVKWENCWNGEIPNQQPSLPLIKQEGSETNS